jgi:hypothetical protein
LLSRRFFGRQDWSELSPHIYADEHDLVLCEFVDPNPGVSAAPRLRRHESTASLMGGSASSKSAASLHGSASTASLPSASSSFSSSSPSSASAYPNTPHSLMSSSASTTSLALSEQDEEDAALLRGLLAYMNNLVLSNGV